MNDLKSKASEYKRVNCIQLVNSDPMLSQFKYHFILRKVYMPRTISLEQLAQKIHQGFKISSLNSHSVYILQLVNVYDKDLVDLAVGFRRDQDATKIARQTTYFDQHGHLAKIELAQGFRIFLEDLKNQAEQNRDESQFFQIKYKKDTNQKSISLVSSKEQPKQKQPQRERSREKNHKKKDMRERFIQNKKNKQPEKIRETNQYKAALLLIPEQTTRNTIVTSLQKRLKEIKDIVSYDFFKKKIPFFNLVFSKPESYEKIIREPLKLQYFHVLPIPYSENIVDELLERQLVYTCIQNSSSKSLASLLRELNSKKKNDIICIIARPHDGSQEHTMTMINNVNTVSLDCGGSSNKEYIVTFFKKIHQIQQYLLTGWTVQKNKKIEIFAEKPSVKWDWYRLMHQLDH